MYSGLRTDLPTHQMQFSDFSFAADAPAHPGHAGVLQYLKQFADKFDLMRHIRTSTQVLKVELLSGDGEAKQPRYAVHVQHLDAKQPRVKANPEKKLETQAPQKQEIETVHCDAVVVANGHYSVPWWPDIPLMAETACQVLHSHFYRTPAAFKGKRVLVVGAGLSGVDIANELVCA